MSRIMTTALALTILLSSTLAAADSTSTAAPKSKRTALIHSLAWTIVPATVGGALMSSKKARGYGIGIASLGVVVGPGTGHAYAREMRPFWVGTAIRGLVVPSTVLIVNTIANSNRDEPWDERMGQLVLCLGVIGVGEVIWAASTIHDIASVGNSVDKYNHNEGFAEVQITPAYFVNRRAPGVMLRLSL